MFETTAAGDEVADALVGVLERLRALHAAAGDSGAWSPRVRRAVLLQLDAVSAAVGLLRGPVVLAERDAGTSQRLGDRSFEAAVGRASGKGFVEARREVRQAETLAAMPVVADAVSGGGMTLAHVDAVARVTSGAGGAVGTGVLGSPSGQAAVVELARGRDAGEFAKDLARLVATQDPAAHERDHATQRAERFLVLSDQANGTVLKGRLDRFAGERLRLALEATGIEPDADRDRPQAMADALVALADSALSGAGDRGATSGAQKRPHVSLLVRDETFAAMLADRRTRELAGSDDPDMPATKAPVVLSESGSPVPRSEVARILCDATVARIVVDADDVPLNLGADKRLYTGAQRRAVIARDKQCAWPGCGIPARWAEVHHIRWWARDRGQTSVSNGVLLCEHHHHLVHQHELAIERHTAGGPTGPDAPPGPGSRSPGVSYTFRTRAGRLVAPPPAALPQPLPSALVSPTPAAQAPTLAPPPPTDAPTPAPPLPAAQARNQVPPPPPAPLRGAGWDDQPPHARPLASGPVAARAGEVSRPATRLEIGAGERRAVQGAPARTGTGRRAAQPSFFDALIAAQPPDPPF